MTFAFCCAEQLMAIKESYDLSYSDLWFCLTLDTVTCVLFDLVTCIQSDFRHYDLCSV